MLTLPEVKHTVMTNDIISVINEITPLSGGDCFYIVERNKTEFTYPLHKHLEFELNYVENAKGVTRIVGDSIEEIDNYDLILITGKELEHTWSQHNCPPGNYREITIQFSSDLFFNNFVDKKQFLSIKQMFDLAQNGVAFPMSAILRIYSLLNRLTTEQQGFYSVTTFLSILYELSLCENMRVLSSSSFARAEVSVDSRRVQKVYDYLNENYASDIRVSQVSELIGMTPISFSRFFKLRTGKSFSDYLIDLRIGYAIRLLADSKQSITEICYNCGFNNQSNFNRIFSKKKGYTPSAFREHYRKKKTLI